MRLLTFDKGHAIKFDFNFPILGKKSSDIKSYNV